MHVCTCAFLFLLLCWTQVDTQGQGGGKIAREPIYLVTTPRRIRPGQTAQIAVNIMSTLSGPVLVRASIRRGNVEVATAEQTFYQPSFSALQLHIPEAEPPGDYKLKVEGSLGSSFPGGLFCNETDLEFFSKAVSVFIQPAKYIFQKQDTMHFRILCVYPNMRPVPTGAITVYLINGRGSVVRRWFQVQVINGLVEIEHKMSHPLRYGYLKIKVEAWGHVYEEKMWSINYFPERIDLNVSMPHYIKEDEYGLIGLVRANLTKGFPVHGNASIDLEIIPPGQESGSILSRKISLFTGAASFNFPMDQIRPWTPRLAGTRLKVTAEVMDWHGLDPRTATAYTEIYSSAMKFKFLGGKVRIFKPGARFPVEVVVYGHDGSMFNRTTHRHVAFIRVHISTSGSTLTLPEERVVIGDDSVAHYSFLPREDDRMIKIRARYIANDDSASYKELVAYRHYTQTGHYIHVFSSTPKPQVNQYMVFTVLVTTFVPDIYYQIIAGGKILVVNRLFMQNTQRTFSVSLSRDMVPSARIIVYCFLGKGEVLADSLNFHVKGVRNDGVSVRVNKGKDFSGDTAELIGTTTPSTLTVFAGQQYDLYQRGQHHFLTEQKVEDELATYDNNANSSFKHTWYLDEYRRQNIFFSAPSYAMDANTTFQFAGLWVLTDAELTRQPGYAACNETQGYLPCHDGSCYPTWKHCDTVWDCPDGADEMGCAEPEDVILPDTISNMWLMEYHLDMSDWLWKKYFTRPNGKIEFHCTVPHRPETWLVQGIALDMENGLAFNEYPARMDTTRPFYIEVEMPSNARRGEQLGVQVTVLNYWTENLETLVTLQGDDRYRFVVVEDFGIVDSYSPRLASGDQQTMVYVPAGESRLIHIPVLPLYKGKTTITITGVSFVARRTVKKTVDITMDGVPNMYHTPYYIDLVNKGSQMIPDLDIPVPEIFKHPYQFRHLYVPGSQEATVTLTGDVVGTGYFKDLNTENLMYLKTGSVENYIYNYAVNLYWLKFLETSHQLTAQQEQAAIDALIKYYPNIIAYRMPNGALSMFRSKAPPCVWCTLFALRVFNEATDPRREYDLYIEPAVLDGMALWVVQQQNITTGAFWELSTIYDRKIYTNNTHSGSHSNVSLTALAVLAFHNNARLNGDARRKAEIARGMAADYISKQVQDLTDPFEICLVTYALHVHGHKDRGNAFYKMMQHRYKDKIYWSREEIPPMEEKIIDTIPYLQPKPETGGHGISVQATSYALLVLLMNNRLLDAEPVMQWLQTQRNTDGAFASSQDSIVALKALSEFAYRDTNRGLYHMLINMRVTSTKDWEKQIRLTRGTFSNYHQVNIPVVWGSVRSTAEGTGRALMQLTTWVNVEYLDQLRPDPVNAFDLRLESYKFSGRNGSRFDMTYCARWLRTDLSPTSGYTIFQLDIPTGYHVHKRELRLLQKRLPLIKRARYTKDQVVLYFDHIPANKSCFDFWAFRWFPVANMTIQNFVRIYDFYEPGYRNFTFYETYNLFHLHICQSCGSFQCPYCPYYNTGPSIYLHILNLRTVFIIAWLFFILLLNAHTGF